MPELDAAETINHARLKIDFLACALSSMNLWSEDTRTGIFFILQGIVDEIREAERQLFGQPGQAPHA